MNCKKCGYQLVDGTAFCPKCGEPNLNPTKETVINQQPKNKIFIPIAIGILAVLIIGIVLFFIFRKPAVETTPEGTNTEIPDTPVTKDPEPTSKVSFRGFVFDIPEYLTATVSATAVTIKNEEDGWMVTLTTYEGGDYSVVVNEKQEKLKASFENGGHVVGTISEKNYSGVDFLIFEATRNGFGYLYSYAPATSNSIFSVTTLNTKNISVFSYAALEEIAPILKNVTTEEEETIQFNSELEDTSSIMQDLFD
jgi:hypothetical protein